MGGHVLRSLFFSLRDRLYMPAHGFKRRWKTMEDTVLLFVLWFLYSQLGTYNVNAHSNSFFSFYTEVSTTEMPPTSTSEQVVPTEATKEKTTEIIIIVVTVCSVLIVLCIIIFVIIYRWVPPDVERWSNFISLCPEKNQIFVCLSMEPLFVLVEKSVNCAPLLCSQPEYPELLSL